MRPSGGGTGPGARRRRLSGARRVVPLLLASLLSPERVTAQETAEQPSLVWPIVGGIGLGGAGLLTGGFVGGLITSGCIEGEDDLCILGGIVIGAALGESIGMALGVHLGNGRRGSLLFDVLTATAIALGGLALLADDDAIFVFPVLQLGAIIGIERANAAHKWKRRRFDVHVFPTPDGRTRVGVVTRF